MLNENDLKAISQLLDEKLDKILDEKLEPIKDDITIIKSDLKTVKRDVSFNRKTDIDVVDYIEKRIDEKLERFKNELNKPA